MIFNSFFSQRFYTHVVITTFFCLAGLSSFSQSNQDYSAVNAMQLYNATNNYTGQLYFPVGTSVKNIRAQSKNITQGMCKKLIRNRVDACWPVLLENFPFSNKEQAYAFFLGLATLESTLGVTVETAIADWGVNPAHSYGPFQTAETGFLNNFEYMPETVPNFMQAPLYPEYFYDPVVSVDMGLRKLCWFSIQAQKEISTKLYGGVSKPLAEYKQLSDFWMLVLKGFNTGWATYDVQENGKWQVNKEWYDFYGSWVPALGRFYLEDGHLFDDVWTYHTDARSEIYLSTPYSWITSSQALNITNANDSGRVVGNPVFYCFPNPVVNKKINLSFKNIDVDEFVLKVINIQGVQVLREKILTSDLSHVVNAASLSAGVYIILIEYGEKRHLEKIIIL